MLNIANTQSFRSAQVKNQRSMINQPFARPVYTQQVHYTCAVTSHGLHSSQKAQFLILQVSPSKHKITLSYHRETC